MAESVFQLMSLINAVICNKVRAITSKILAGMMSQNSQLSLPADNNTFFCTSNRFRNNVLVSRLCPYQHYSFIEEKQSL